MSVSLSARNVVKRYGGVVALSDANLDVHSGEVVALIGANGSGKSTLSKIINGVVVLDGGQLLLDDKPVHFSSPQTAKQMGIATVFQELSLIPQMTVSENIWLTREPLRGGLVDHKNVRLRTEELVALFEGTHKFSLHPDSTVDALPPDEKQIIEVLKALSSDPRLIILDEATASLDSRQVQRLFELVASWKQQGKAVVFVSHRMEEIFRIADRFSVLRNGKTVGAGLMKEITERELVGLMVEKATATSVVQRQRQVLKKNGDQKIRLEVHDLRTDLLKGVDLQLRDGELLGIGGLKGQGQRDLLLALFGDLPYTGSVVVSGEAVHFKLPRQAIEKGIALVPGERAKEGLLYIRSILENLMLPSWAKFGIPLHIGKARQAASEVSNELQLIMAGLEEPVSSLSGGNAQKVVIGKWLLRNPKLLLLDDPTKGVDVGTKAEFYRLLARLCDNGTAILFYSSDDEELLGLCDRVLVMHDGVIRSELSGESLTKSNLIAASLGASNASLHEDPSSAAGHTYERRDADESSTAAPGPAGAGETDPPSESME
ncbi:MAG: sugar ABC transporter ATP-binding protein [Chloroflexi bacterium]|nr:sugar ABC transporter ATP-binding protein [Chloroflexota bacterium]